jgi:serine O-acetyltransferase
MHFKELYKADMQRYKNNPPKYQKRLLYHFRKSQSDCPKLLRYYHVMMYYRLARKNGIEIYHKCRIGKGFYIGHPYGITINDRVVIGDFCNIHKGATIGQENRGARKGAPVIGNNVWIGINSTVVGGITVGDDVLIAPNSFVNCDVPSHSVVFGNPCVIKHRDFATDGYISYFE